MNCPVNRDNCVVLSRLVSEAVQIYRRSTKNELVKYQLAVNALGITLWEMDITGDDPVNPSNRLTWSAEFRRMLGFENEIDFPNTLGSWIDRLHPDDRERVLDIVAVYIDKRDGTTPYNIEYRLMHKNGDYHYFRDFGSIQQDEAGVPVRIVGALVDIQEQARTKAALEHREEMLKSLNKMADKLLSHDDDNFDDVMSMGLEPVSIAANVDIVAVFRCIDDDGNLGQVYRWKGATISTEEDFRVLPEIPVISRWLEILSKDECINANVQRMPEDEADFLSKYGIKSIFMTPIITRGQFWGMVAFEDHTNYRFFDDEYLDLLQSAAHLCAGAVVRTEMEREIKWLVTETDKIYIDALTGIYNRRYFDKQLSASIAALSRSKDWLSLMMIDIDCFKYYNDTYGHSEGDNCLRRISDALSKTITRTGDFIARYGGEEFAVVLPNTDEGGARLIAGKLLDCVRNCEIPHTSSLAAGFVTISIGITSGMAFYTQSTEDYIRRADEMLYISKQNGRNQYTFKGL